MRPFTFEVMEKLKTYFVNIKGYHQIIIVIDTMVFDNDNPLKKDNRSQLFNLFPTRKEDIKEILGKLKSIVAKNGWWMQKGGDLIHVTEMDTSHLLNAMAFLERKAKAKHSETVGFYASCPGPRGEMAQVAFEQEYVYWMDASWESCLPFIYELMGKELDSREKWINVEY